MKKSNLSSKTHLLRISIILCLLSSYLWIAPGQVHALPAGFQEYYVLGHEEQLYSMFDYIDGKESGVPGSITSNLMASVVTLVASADYQVIYYDHWEDGYEADLLDPTQASTEVYGDGNTGNGGTGSDILAAGDILSLNSDGSGSGVHSYVPVNPRGTSIRYDGGDHVISSGGPIDLAHAVWPSDGTWIGGAWEIYSLQAYQTAYSYRLPIGADLYAYGGGDTGYFGDFKYVWLQLQAFYDNTHVSIDNGTDTVNVTLDQGQTYSSMGYINSASYTNTLAITINAGTTVLSDKPIQVGLVTGADGTFRTDLVEMLPDLVWGEEYIAPIPRGGSAPAEVYIFNPNDHAISVTAYDLSGSGTFSIPANVISSTVAYRQPTAMGRYAPANSAVRLVSADPFGAIVCADTSNTTYDWSFTPIPVKYLTQDYYISWAPGSSNNPPTENGSPVWVTPVANNTTFYVDYGPVDGNVDLTFSLDTLQIKRIFDPDKDNTGMHIWATGKFAVVWGEDPATAGSADPYLDLGITTLPLYQGWLDPVLSLEKTVHPEILPVGGGTATFVLKAETHGPSPVTNVDITDTLPISWTYVAGSTIVTYPDGSQGHPEPAINGQDLFWNLSHEMRTNQTLSLQFDARIQTGGSVGVTRSDGFESGQSYSGGTGSWASNWTETGESDGPAGGRIQVVTSSDGVNPYAGSWELRLQNKNRSIERSVNLSGFARPTLRFKRYAYQLETGDNFYLDIYDGSSWRTGVITWTDGSQENTWVQEKVDLSAYSATTTTIRFRSPNDSKDDADRLYVDDVEIYDAVVVSENQGRVVGEYRGHVFNATDDAVVYISALDLEKAVSRSTVGIGNTIVYTLTYENSGAITTTGTYINDTVPWGTTFSGASSGGSYIGATNIVSWTLPNVGPSKTGSVTFTVTVGNEATDGTVIENLGRINSNQTGPANSNVVKTTVLAPDLDITKSGPANASKGDWVTYTIQYANNGGAAATGVVISDSIPVSTTYVPGSLAIITGTQWVTLTDAVGDDQGAYISPTLIITPGTIAAGESGTIRFSVQITSSLPGGTIIFNRAIFDRDGASPQNTALVATAISDLTIEKSADQTVAVAGDVIEYALTYGNHGAITETNVSIYDTIPAPSTYVSGTATGSGLAVEYSVDHRGTWTTTVPSDPSQVTDLRWSRAELVTEATGTAGFHVRLPEALPGGTTLSNFATITSTQSGPIYSNFLDIQTVDLVIHKMASSSYAFPGGTITYTITYGNNGSANATGVTITDTVPVSATYVPGSITGAGADDSGAPNLVWNVGTVVAGARGLQASFAVTINAGTITGTNIVNTATISDNLDSVTSNESNVTVASAGVTISPNRSDNSHDQGQRVCYGHAVNNTGDLTNTMELTATHSNWTSAGVSFYKDNDSDGNYDVGLDTPLTDSNSNAITDTGELAPGRQVDILACFTIPVSGVNDGDSDTLVVQATTADGVPTYSSQVTDMTMVKTYNFLNISAPADGLITNTVGISVTGSTNPNATVVITNTATGVVYSVQADGLGNFAATITTTLGSNLLDLSSTDLDGDVATTSRTVTLVPDPTDSENSVTIVQPATGAVTYTAAISVTGMTDPGSTLTVTVGSAEPYTTTADGSGTYSVTVTLPVVGLNTIVVTSTDPFGNDASATRDVQLTNDSTDLTNSLVITSPTSGQVLTTSVISVIGQTDPGSILTVTVSTGDVETGTAGSGDGTFTIGGVNLVLGSNVITVESLDPFGNPISATLTVILTNDNTPSTNAIAITSPATGHITTTVSISVNGQTDPGSVITLTTTAGTFNTTANASGDFSTTVTLAQGWNTVVATSTDVYGQVATDTIQIRLTNDTTPGGNDLAIIFPPVGYVTSTATIPVTGTTNADSVITATVGSNGPYITTADSGGFYTVTVTLPVTGMNTLVVTSTDLYGHDETATRDVRLTNDNTPGSAHVEIVFPPVGYVTDTITIPVTGTADPGGTITATVEGVGPYTTTVDADGFYTVTVTLPTAGMNTIVVTVTDLYGNNDTANRDVQRNPTVDFSSTTYSVDEGDGTATVTVTLSATSNLTATVDYATSDGTAVAGDDYTAISGTLTFTPGVTSQTIAVAIGNDPSDEDSETLSLDLSNASNANIGGKDPATLTIVDDDDAPGISISDATVTEGDAGSTSAVFTVTLSAASGQAITVDYATANGTATAGDDYTAISTTTLNFPAGITVRTITVQVKGDTVDEGDETFLVNLSNATNAAIADGQGVGTITDDDDVPTISISDAAVTEGDSGTTNAVFTVTLSVASGQAISVDYATANGTATAGDDYTAVSTTTLSFPAGSRERTITVQVKGDVLDEMNETFWVNLDNATNATIADGQGVGTITDDDGLPTLSISAATVTEGDSGTTSAVFTVILSAVSGKAISVDYATANGTATAGDDYTAISMTTLNFPAGSRERTITVQIKGDTLAEGDETFFVNLSSPTNATIADGQGIGTIVDDDASPSISINDVTVTEGDSVTTSAVFTVTLSAASGQAITVGYATANGTATAGADYTAIAKTTLNFPAGTTERTVTVQVRGDTLDENDEAFFVNLSNATNATIADGQGIGTITDDDGLPTISISDAMVTEGNTGSTNAIFTVILSVASGRVITVDYATANGTATAGDDYAAISTTTLSFPAGTTVQIITVQVKGDTVDEGDETFFVNLSNATNATVADGQGTGTITDDDASAPAASSVYLPIILCNH